MSCYFILFFSFLFIFKYSITFYCYCYYYWQYPIPSSSNPIMEFYLTFMEIVSKYKFLLSLDNMQESNKRVFYLEIVCLT